MSNLLDFIQNNISLDNGGLVACVQLGIVWMVIYDLYHMLISAVLSWFKK